MVANLQRFRDHPDRHQGVIRMAAYRQQQKMLLRGNRMHSRLFFGEPDELPQRGSKVGLSLVHGVREVASRSRSGLRCAFHLIQGVLQLLRTRHPAPFAGPIRDAARLDSTHSNVVTGQSASNLRLNRARGGNGAMPAVAQRAGFGFVGLVAVIAAGCGGSSASPAPTKSVNVVITNTPQPTIAPQVTRVVVVTATATPKPKGKGSPGKQHHKAKPHKTAVRTKVHKKVSHPKATETPRPKPSPTHRAAHHHAATRATATPHPAHHKARRRVVHPAVTPKPTATSTPRPHPTRTPTATPRAKPTATSRPASHLYVGSVHHTAAQAKALQSGADAGNPADTLYLNPVRVVRQKLPSYGFTGKFQIEPQIKFVVQYRSQRYDVFLAQPLGTGPAAVWRITKIFLHNREPGRPATPGPTPTAPAIPAGAHLGIIPHTSSTTRAIQKQADAGNPAYVYYLNPERVLYRQLPSYGFTAPFTLQYPLKVVVFYRPNRKQYDVLLNQPQKHDPTGIWLISTIQTHRLS